MAPSRVPAKPAAVPAARPPAGKVAQPPKPVPLAVHSALYTSLHLLGDLRRAQEAATPVFDGAERVLRDEVQLLSGEVGLELERNRIGDEIALLVELEQRSDMKALLDGFVEGMQTSESILTLVARGDTSTLPGSIYELQMSISRFISSLQRSDTSALPHLAALPPSILDLATIRLNLLADARVELTRLLSQETQ